MIMLILVPFENLSHAPVRPVFPTLYTLYTLYTDNVICDFVSYADSV